MGEGVRVRGDEKDEEKLTVISLSNCSRSLILLISSPPPPSPPFLSQPFHASTAQTLAPLVHWPSSSRLLARVRFKIRRARSGWFRDASVDVHSAFPSHPPHSRPSLPSTPVFFSRPVSLFLDDWSTVRKRSLIDGVDWVLWSRSSLGHPLSSSSRSLHAPSTTPSHRSFDRQPAPIRKPSSPFARRLLPTALALSRFAQTRPPTARHLALARNRSSRSLQSGVSYSYYMSLYTVVYNYCTQAKPAVSAGLGVGGTRSTFAFCFRHSRFLSLSFSFDFSYLFRTAGEGFWMRRGFFFWGGVGKGVALEDFCRGGTKEWKGTTYSHHLRTHSHSHQNPLLLTSPRPSRKPNPNALFLSRVLFVGARRCASDGSGPLPELDKVLCCPSGGAYKGPSPSPPPPLFFRPKSDDRLVRLFQLYLCMGGVCVFVCVEVRPPLRRCPPPVLRL